MASGPSTTSSPMATTLLHTANLALSGSLLLVYFERLQEQADLPLFKPNSILSPSSVEAMIRNDRYVAIAGFLVHLIAMRMSKTRVILTELLTFISWPLLFAMEFMPITSVEDRLMFQLIFSAFTFLLSTCNVVSPRKRKHTKRPNNPFSSAFSIGSTATSSQCSSIAPTRRSQPASLAEYYSEWIDEDDAMDTSPALNDALPDLKREDSMQREVTPFTEISGRLKKLCFDNNPTKLLFNPPKSQAPKMLSSEAITPSSQKRKKGPFSSLNFHAISKESPTNWPQSLFNSYSSTSTLRSSPRRQNTPEPQIRRSSPRRQTTPSLTSSQSYSYSASSTYLSNPHFHSPTMRSAIASSISSKSPTPLAKPFSMKRALVSGALAAVLVYIFVSGVLYNLRLLF